MDIDLRQVLLQILNFGVLFFVLVKFLFRPILDILDKRSTKIEEGLKLAEINAKERAAIEKKSEDIMKKADKKAADIMAEARAESKKLAKTLLDEARKESELQAEKMKKALDEQIKEEERLFKDRIAELVVSTTERLLRDSLTSTDISKITKKELAKLKELK